jgi:hypothetical protein
MGGQRVDKIFIFVIFTFYGQTSDFEGFQRLHAIFLGKMLTGKNLGKKKGDNADFTSRQKNSSSNGV